jgi:hypothetical protein
MNEDTKTRRHEDTKTRRHEDTKTRRRGRTIGVRHNWHNTEKQAGRQAGVIICTLVIKHFRDIVTRDNFFCF